MNHHCCLVALSLMLSSGLAARAAGDTPADPTLASDQAKTVSATVKHDAKAVADAAKAGAKQVAAAAKQMAHGVAAAAKEGAEKTKAAVSGDKAAKPAPKPVEKPTSPQQ
jgi:hypothetical protein